jgi:hypothetical protein
MLKLKIVIVRCHDKQDEIKVKKKKITVTKELHSSEGQQFGI